MTDSKLALSFCIYFSFAAALAVGCKATADKPSSGAPQDSASAFQLGKAKAASLEATQAMGDYAYARKAEFVADMNKELGEVQDNLNLLAAKADRASGAAKADAKDQLAAVRAKWTKTKQQLDQAENATESTWNDVKSGFKESYAGLKDSVDTTRQWLSEKIAP
jgi:ABC-type transporter Mla subunit MlaD